MSATITNTDSANEGTPWHRLLLSKRWLAYLLVTVLFGAACVGLGLWQFARREEARVEIERILANYDSAPVALRELVPSLPSYSEATKWHPVETTGTYLADQQFLVRSRPRGQQPGYEVLSPLQLANGDVFVVDRGWLPAGNNAEQVPSIPAPPSGLVTVVSRLKAGEPSIPGRTYSNGQLATIELPLVASLINKPTFTGTYGLLESETPTAAGAAPLPALRPQLDEGNHLSYAFQWLTFAILGFVGLGWAIRNEWRIRNADRPEQQAKEALRARKRAQKKTAEQLEDEQLENS